MDQSTGYGQYCPITRAVEVLGERWSVLIVRDMLCGHTKFNDLARGNPGLSRTLLSKRLRQLERAGIVEHTDDRYLLTPAGLDLRQSIFSLGEWAARWQFGDPRENELDPQLLMWWVHTRIDFSQFPDRRIVLEFRFRDEPRRFWIMKDALGPSVCMSDPGFDIDAIVESDLRTLHKVWLGKMALAAAFRDNAILLHGSPTIVRKIPEALQLSPLAPSVTASAT